MTQTYDLIQDRGLRIHRLRELWSRNIALRCTGPKDQPLRPPSSPTMRIRSPWLPNGTLKSWSKWACGGWSKLKLRSLQCPLSSSSPWSQNQSWMLCSMSTLDLPTNLFLRGAHNDIFWKAHRWYFSWTGDFLKSKCSAQMGRGRRLSLRKTRGKCCAKLLASVFFLPVAHHWARWYSREKDQQICRLWEKCQRRKAS